MAYELCDVCVMSNKVIADAFEVFPRQTFMIRTTRNGPFHFSYCVPHMLGALNPRWRMLIMELETVGKWS